MTTEGPLGRFAAFMRSLTPPSPSDTTPGAMPRDLRNSLGFWGALLALTVLAGGLRFYAVTHFSYTHPDEEIARAVVVSVLKNDDSDTNWARTDVAKQFSYTEYNFSSYYLFAADVQRLLGTAQKDIENQIGALRKNLRLLSAALGALCILFAGLLGWRVGGRFCGLATALLSACDVTLFQDSLYARPETFVTLLTLWFLLVLMSTRIHRGLVLTVAGFLLGVLIACKITFLLYFPFPLLLAPALLSDPKDGKPAEGHLFLWSGSLSAYFLAIGAGFALGAPYALQFPWEYVEGLVPLMKQYEHGAWLNGHDPGVLARFGNSGAYLAYTLGYPALLLALVGLVHTLWRRDVRLLLTLGGPLLTLLYFMQTRAFYERNFSQALPLLLLLVGIGIKALSDLIRKSPLLQSGAAAVMLLAAAIAPALVTAKAIDPALDGRYQSEVEAEAAALSDGGRVPVFYGWHFNEFVEAGRPFCGRYVIGLRDFRDERLPQGYNVIGYVHSVFGDYPLSTLQTYLSQPMIFLSPIESKSCALELAALVPQPGETPLKAPLSRSSDWPADSALRTTPEDSWPWPRYSSWGGSDKNTGTLTLGPFRACTDFVVPYAIGAARRGVSLRITRGRAGAAQVLYDGIPLSAPDRWQQLTVHVPAGQCSDYSVTATDAGQGWQQWLGIGVPVVIGNRPATH